MTAPAGIVWLASFPKSGNTWFRIFLANLDAGNSGPVDINKLDRHSGLAGSRQDFEASTMLDSGLLSHDDVDRLRPRVYENIAREISEQRWMKVHDAYTALPNGEPLLGQSAQAAVYLVRDPRDVAISLSHHGDMTIDDAIALMGRADGAMCQGRHGLESQLRQQLCGWSGHVASWLDQADVPVLLIRYEDLHADPAAHFSRALAFAGREAGNAEIEQAVRHAKFSELRRQEDAAGFGERTSRTAPFFRAGTVGDWRSVLTLEQRVRIEDAHAAMMERLGYARTPATIVESVDAEYRHR